MSRSAVTHYEKYSIFSGTPTTTHHHLLFGRGIRPLAEDDGIWIPVTDQEHNMSPYGTKYQIHDNPMAEKLSKLLGEVAWEKQELIKELSKSTGIDEDKIFDEVRQKFKDRYGRNYL